MKRHVKANGRVYGFTIVFHPSEDGGYWVSVPSLPGCYSQGATLQEAERMVEEAIQLTLECMIEDGEEIPDEQGAIVRNINIALQPA